jgi:hypothetical protein
MGSILYTKSHRRALRQLWEKSHPQERVPLWVRLHDLDKVVLLSLGVSKKFTSWIHRKFSFHHVENIFGVFNMMEMVYDWESARYTKVDKPLNAVETARKYYPQFLQHTQEISSKEFPE